MDCRTGEVRMINFDCRSTEAFSSEVAFLTCQRAMVPAHPFALPFGEGFRLFGITGLSCPCHGVTRGEYIHLTWCPCHKHSSVPDSVCRVTRPSLWPAPSAKR